MPLLPLLLVVFFFFTSESVSTAARSEWDLRNFEPGREERDDLAICKFETRIAYAFKNNKDNPNIGVHKSDDACEVSILFVLLSFFFPSLFISKIWMWP